MIFPNSGIHEEKILLHREDIKSLGIWLSNSQLLRLEIAGRFPRRIRLSGASICWDKSEIMTWIEHRKQERNDWHYADENKESDGELLARSVKMLKTRSEVTK